MNVAGRGEPHLFLHRRSKPFSPSDREWELPIRPWDKIGMLCKGYVFILSGMDIASDSYQLNVQ